MSVSADGRTLPGHGSLVVMLQVLRCLQNICIYTETESLTAGISLITGEFLKAMGCIVSSSVAIRIKRAEKRETISFCVVYVYLLDNSEKKSTECVHLWQFAL